MTFAGVLRAEFVKLFSTRLWWVLALILFVYIACHGRHSCRGVRRAGRPASRHPAATRPRVPPGELHLIVYSVASTVGYVFPVLLGALATTSEFRHQTLTPTFLASPRRVGVLAAKLVTMAVAGAGLRGGVACGLDRARRTDSRRHRQ